jgi:transcriptional regulator with PAS, ATPase and Fis domain
MERFALLLPDDRVDHRDLASIAGLQMPRSGTSFDPHAIHDGDFELPDGGLDLEGLISRIITKALEKHQGNQTKTALYLGISRRVLQGRTKKFSGGI